MTIWVLNPFSWCLPFTHAGIGTHEYLYSVDTRYHTTNGVSIDKKGDQSPNEGSGYP